MEKNYKDTLLMMQTAFSMRANLPQKEPERLAEWERAKVYEALLAKNAGGKLFVLHDGPPYANAPIHVGHALNKVLKDFIIRSKAMQGYRTPYIPGWDTHGLPIEVAMLKSLKVDRRNFDPVLFREECAKYALHEIERQKRGFKRLGVLGNWQAPYVTLDKEYVARQLEVFASMVEAGLVFKGSKPVYWSPSSETALAEAEIEYQDVTSPSLYLAFKVADGKGVADGAELVIWTTTPWTIPANLAVSVHPDYKYVILTSKTRKFIVAEELAESFQAVTGCTGTVSAPFAGRKLEGVTYFHPLTGKLCPVICGRHVTLETGTGLVHTAPGHGEDDFIIGSEYGLPPFCPVDEHGVFTAEAGEFAGLFYEKANPVILAALEAKGAVVFASEFVHSYPHDWRTKKPVIFRATPQWFMSIDKIKPDLLKAIDETTWIPEWGKVRMHNMIADRKDWCISRQRMWGVVIPVFYGEDGTALLDKKLILHFAGLVREHGDNIWWQWPAEKLLPAGFTSVHSPNGKFTLETDTMDVWFDSGSSHYAVTTAHGLPEPVDLYIEGSDQYRGWFNSSLITGVALTGRAPYKAVISHGFVLDGAGNKMSKSLGNVIDPLQVCEKYGADVFRLWVASTHYTADVRIDEAIIRQQAESYRKIRNTLRFLLGNLFDFSAADCVPFAKRTEVDQYQTVLLNELIENTLAAYNAYAFDDAYRLLVNFINVELSSFYLDFAKDILYVEAAAAPARRSLQSVLWETFTALLALLTPLMPFTTEEALIELTGDPRAKAALLAMPEVAHYPEAAELKRKYAGFLAIRADILKALELARNEKTIGKSLGASVYFAPTPQAREILTSLKTRPELLLIISELKIVEEVAGDQYPSGVIKVTPRDGTVCDRCWQTFAHPEIGPDGLCSRCRAVVNERKE